MNDEEKKGPGRPKKYATDAERKKAYRERKKEERQTWEKLIEVFHELMMPYNVQAEISRRERDTKLDSSIEKLERRLEDLEKTLTDEKERAVKESYARRKEKKDSD